MNSADEPLEADAPGTDFVAPTAEEMGAQLPQYEIRGLIAKGGMGAIYEAYQPQLDRKVALKVLRADGAMGGEYAEHFRSEARAMARLQHSNIVAVHDFGETPSGLHYIVMEYAEGYTLLDLIQGGALDQTGVLHLVSQICAALQFAHERGVIHRDIKPANILVGLDWSVKVADFGLAKLQGTVGGLGDAAFGTPEYAAPEVRDPNVEVDHRVDIYAVGVMIYEMLVGVPMEPGSNDVPSRLVDCDPRFDRIVTNATNVLPGGRYQQASGIAVEIEKIRANPGGRQLRVGAAARTGGLASRNSRTPSLARARGAKGRVKAASQLRTVPGGGGGGMTWLLVLLFAAVMAVVFWAVNHFKPREPQAPVEKEIDPLEEAASSLP